MWLTRKEIIEKYPNAWIHKDAKIHKDVRIDEDVRIWNDAKIYEGAMILKGAVIWRDVLINEGVVIGKGAIILESAEIYKSAKIQECARIHKRARIGRNRKNVKDCLVINGLGKTKLLTAFTCDDGLIICIGCMNNYKGHTLEQTRIEIAKKYDESHEYFDALSFIKKWYKNLKSCK